MDDGVDIPNEETSVPEKFATLYEYTGKIQLGLLGEGLDSGKFLTNVLVKYGEDYM